MNSVTPPVCTHPVQDYLTDLHHDCSRITDGKVATYIPELAKADPNWFGICLVTAGGSLYEIGNSRQDFTIQSISKPFVYGLALEQQGRAHTLARVGMEPTGDAFNSISLDPVTGRPRNPMINAGAIATAGLIAGKTPASRLRRITDMLGACAGRELGIDQAVYQSESATGHRNRAIGFMLRNFDILESDPQPVVELYFQQCSVSVTCRDLGVMAATLANHGVNPITGKQALRGEYVESVLSVMGSCGMYDFAGEWIYQIGMPAKSGVSGGIIAVLPGQLGIGVFSPPLDARGNSVRGIRVCNEISRALDLHLFNQRARGRAVIHLKYTGAEINSSRVRTDQERHALCQHGARLRIWQLQDHLMFSNTELVVHDILEDLPGTAQVLLDLSRVLSINESSCRLFFLLACKIADAGKSLVFTRIERLPSLKRYMMAKLEKGREEIFHVIENHELALEWCENRMLDALLPGRPVDQIKQRYQYELFHGFSEAQVALVSSLLRRHVYQAGQVVIHADELARDLFFIARGGVSVWITLASGTRKRLASFSSGMAFGEMAVIDGAPRSATITADGEVECDLLDLEALKDLGNSEPLIRVKLLENLCLGLCQKLRKANRELSIRE